MNDVLTYELAKKIEQAEVAALTSRLTAIQDIDGNPMGVEIQQFGNATAFSVKNIPGPAFNTVKGISSEELELLDDIIDFYQQKEIDFRWEVTPAHSSIVLLSRLSEKGFYQADFHSALYGQTKKQVNISNLNLTIRPLGENEFSTFAEIYAEAFHIPSFLKGAIAENNKVLHNKEGWRFYLAEIGSTPSGIGVLYTENGIGSLAAAATLPAFQRKGIHTALLKRRIHEAFKENCSFVVGQAKYGSDSQTNMLKAGMQIAYTKAVWMKK